MKKSRNPKKQISMGKVVIPTGHPSPPESHEVDAAFILANHFNCTIEFIMPIDDYKRKTADIIMNGIEWEMKSPIGDSKSTIGNQFRKASKQSHNVIIDAHRTKIKDSIIERSVLFELKSRPSVRSVILITKKNEVLVFKK